MAVAQVGSTAKSTSGSAGTSVVVTLPNTATAGNLLIVEVGGSAAGVRTPNTPAGWALVQSGGAAPSNAGMLWVFSKVAAGGETSVTVTWTGSMTPGWRAFEFSGADTTTPVVAAPAFTTDTSAGATIGITGTTRTTAAADEFQLAVAGGRAISASSFNTHSFGGGYTESDTVGTGSTGAAAAATRTDSSAGTVITPTFTFTNLQGSPVAVFGNISIAAAVSGTFVGSAAVAGAASIVSAGTAGGSASRTGTATITAAGRAGGSAAVAASATITAAGVVTGAPSGAQLTYTVEIDVSGSAFGTAFSATDVTARAVAGMGFEPVTITWGRQDQFSSVNPTTVTGSLLNSDGLLSPGNTSGTYYPHIRRGLRRRIWVGVNSTTLALSEDYATTLEVVPANDTPAVLNIEGSDILARFGGTASTSDPNAPSIGTTMRSFLAEEMALDSVTALYMMQEADGAASFADVMGTFAPLTVTASKYGAGTVTAGQPPSGQWVAGTAVELTNPAPSTTHQAGSYLALPTTTSGFSIGALEVWVQVAPGTPAATQWIAGTPSGGVAGSTNQFLLEMNTDGTVAFTFSNGSGSVVVTSIQAINDGAVHQLFAFSDGVSVGIAIDLAGGVETMHAYGPTTVGTSRTPFTVGMSSSLTEAFTGLVTYLAIWGTSPDSAHSTRHWVAGTTAFSGLTPAALSGFRDGTGDRILRLLSYRPNTGNAVPTGGAAMGVQDIAGRSLQDCIFETAQVEAGVVVTSPFGAGPGLIAFFKRGSLFNPAVDVTFDMHAGGVDFGSNWREDTQGVVNDVTITNQTTGSDQRFFDAASIALDGEFSTSLQLPVYQDTDALNLAGWMVANGTLPQITATPLILDLLHLSPAQAQAALQLAPLDVIRLTNCPTPAPAATMTFVVQGGTISLAADAATATLNLTPYPYPVGVWDTTTWDAAGVTWSF